MLVFPEMSLCGYGLNSQQINQFATETLHILLEKISKLSHENQINLIVSGPKMTTLEKPSNSVFLLNDKGDIKEIYQKQFLFGDRENECFVKGESTGSFFSINNIKVGCLVCYDAEFPENFRELALCGVQLVIVPTADCEFQTNIIPKREVSINIATSLLPAFSLSNEVFIGYANYAGTEENEISGDVLSYRGNSIITSPQGDILVSGQYKEASMLIADIAPADYDHIYDQWGYNQDFKKTKNTN